MRSIPQNDCVTTEDFTLPAAAPDQVVVDNKPPKRKRGRPRLKERPGGWRKGPFIGQIPVEIENEMFAVYCTLPNLSHVARTTKVSVFTVRKYAKEQDWEGRRADIIKKAREQADYTLTKATEQSITLVRALKAKVAEKISKLAAQELNTDSLIADTERLVKLEQILLGRRIGSLRTDQRDPRAANHKTTGGTR